ncbi:APC family permease [Sphingomonas sp.]|uniref:APC family permease n=1 Tax=Sphingomonas sp. TaxID=28214 RepID=UPI003B3B1472
MATTPELAVEQQGRDHGLVRAMGVFAFAAAITNEVVGAGIYTLPAKMASSAGTTAPYAYIACLIAMGAVVLCFSEAGSRISTSGGPYGYVEAAFGKMLGFVAGVLLWLSAVLAAGGIAVAATDMAGAAFPFLVQPVVREILIVGLLAIMAGINIVGVDLAAKVLGWATMIKVLPLILFLVVGGIALAMGHRAEAPITHIPNANFGHAVILAMFALTGMETPLAASGEVRDPARTVPRALILAMGLIGLLYVAIQLIAATLFGAGLMHSAAPLADALGTIDPRLRAPLLAGACFSMVIWLGSDFLGAPRVLFAFARDGLLPAALGKVHPRWRTPHWAILVHFLFAVALALTGTFEQLAILSTLAIAPLYFLACASAVILRSRGIATLGKPLSLPGIPVIAGFGMLCMAIMVALADWNEIGALAGVLVGSCLLYLVMRPRTPKQS